MRSLCVAATAAIVVIGASACSDPTSPSTSRVAAVNAPSLNLVGATNTTTPFQPALASDMCVDVPASTYSNGQVLETWSCHLGPNQQFLWKPTGEIVPSAAPSMCVDAAGGQGADGDAIIIWSCWGGANQKWTASANGEITGINGKCIGLVNAVRANGTRLALQTCNGSIGQKWNNAAGSSAPAVPSGTPIYPGQSIQAAVNANPAGTTFILKTGTHTGQRVIPKSGDSFIGETGTVLDGQGAPYAFAKGGVPYPSNVTIRGLKITNYSPAFQSATVDAGGYSTGEGTTGWVIDRNEVSYNGEYGIRIGNSTQVTNNNVHHNLRLNLAGSGNNTVISGNEVAYGNYTNQFNTNFEAGGTKFAQCSNVTISNNYVHDNYGVGIHFDENNINNVIDGNRIDHNGSEGIAIEISYATIIRNNTITNNGWFDPRNRYTYLWNAGIGIHASPNVEVYGNTVSGNYAGIVAIQQNRDGDAAWYGQHIVANLYVHNNTITQNNLPRNSNELSAASGAAQDEGDLSIFTSRNNRWVNNTYYLGPNNSAFAWMNGMRSGASWRGYGLDVSGIFN